MKLKVAILAVALVLVGVSRAQAASITINSVAGTNYTTNGFTDFSVDTSQMNGMQVTAYWTDASGAHSLMSVWNSGVSFGGENFDIVVSGDTFNNNAWELDFAIAGNGLLQKLVFNGINGNTVFDRTNPSTGTAGSDQGKDFAGFSEYNGNITATYRNAVSLGAAAALGDVYAQFELEFLTGGGLGEMAGEPLCIPILGCFGQSGYKFTLDTDIATTNLIINPNAEVPEPGSMILLGTGLLGLAAAARRRARKA